MDLHLNGKTALVCGSTAGIGKATAIELAKLGSHVILLARNTVKLAKTLAELPKGPDQKHHAVTADFSDLEALKTAVDEIRQNHQVHLLVNNTGGPPSGPAFEADPDQYAASFSQHLLCNQILTQAVVPSMKKAKYGRIVNVISTSV